MFELWKALTEQNLYSKPFQIFKNELATEENQEILYNTLLAANQIDKKVSLNSFKSTIKVDKNASARNRVHFL